MRTSTRRLLPMVVTALLLQATVAAAQPAAPAESPKPAPTPSPEPAASKTQHQVQIGGEVIRYTATAGWLIMQDDAGKPIARFGYTAYTADGVTNLSRRPVTFAFNGGPGSSSIWLHMGVLGPRRVVVNDPGYAPPPPSERADNPVQRARRHRPGDDRPGRHRLQQGARRGQERRLLGRGPGHPLGGRVHQALRIGERALGLAQVHPRRELRRNAHGRPRLPRAVRARHEPERRGAGLAVPERGLGHRRDGDRPAARALPSDARGHRLVPRRDPEEVRLDRRVHGRGGALRLRGVHAGADARLRDLRPRRRAGWPRSSRPTPARAPTTG